MRSSTAIDFTSPAALSGTHSRQTGDTAGPSAGQSSRLACSADRPLLRPLCARTHDHDHALGIRRAVIIEQVIRTPVCAAKRSITFCTIPEPLHGTDCMLRAPGKHVGFCAVPRSPAGPGSEPAAVFNDVLVVHHGADGLVADGQNLATSCEVRKPSKK